jgi:hypothetical protein
MVRLRKHVSYSNLYQVSAKDMWSQVNGLKDQPMFANRTRRQTQDGEVVNGTLDGGVVFTASSDVRSETIVVARDAGQCGGGSG